MMHYGKMAMGVIMGVSVFVIASYIVGNLILKMIGVM